MIDIKDTSFFICLIVLLICLPLHFLSVSHSKLTILFGEQKGDKLGKALGIISGWGFFLCLMGLWISPQPIFIIPAFNMKLIILPLLNIPIYLMHIILATPFIIISIWFGISGVLATGLEVADYHKPNKVIRKGIYAKIRHPQYFAAIIAHIGFSILFAGLFSLLSTPIIVIYNYLISRKEEIELIKEFGKEYEEYKEKVPMFIPRLRK
ncbi:MAG: Isoprenylcysteine carboxyl methyltransferase (ICMT) family protein [Promethearchaeota archaeon]|nr:MAG: Isoprenylcysteine carboxyl methyltransferase (ICMT) family protein [Candidatus Lokiarchaeota archaeon]